MTTKQKNKMERSQLAALKKRLARGRLLTAAQMAFVERFNSAGKDTSAGESDTAAGVSVLARRLGVSRQSIAWHRGRADAPKDFSVPAWRNYLLTHGKGGTIERVESAGKVRREPYNVIFGDGLLAAHGFGMGGIADFLEFALLAAEIETTPEQRDKVAIWLWLISAARVHRVGMNNGYPDTPLTDVESDPQAAPEDNDWCPSGIRAAAKRINFHLDSARDIFTKRDPR